MSRRGEMLFDGACAESGCGGDAAQGKTRCRVHLQRHADYSRSSREMSIGSRRLGDLLKPSTQPRPDWMSDPSLLPKRPPTAVKL